MSPRARPRPYFRVAQRTNWEHRRQRERPRGGRGEKRPWRGLALACVGCRTAWYDPRDDFYPGAGLSREPRLCTLYFRAQVSGFQNSEVNGADVAFLKELCAAF